MDSLSPPLHVLIVSPRPEGVEPPPSRASVEGVCMALEEQGDQVRADWLWPATLGALSERLGASNEPGIDAVYLDAVLGEDAGNASLSFETAEGSADFITVGRVLDTLNERGVSLLILRPVRGQGALAPGAHSLLAESLSDRGDVHALLLDEGLSADEVRQAMSGFLAGLLAQSTLGQACHDARTALGRESQEGSLPAVRLCSERPDLALFPRGEDESDGVSKIVRFPQPTLAPAWRRLAAQPQPGGLPATPTHGFVGRTRELIALERALRETPTPGPKPGVVWVHGHEGMGKTTLVAHAARWCVRTGRFAQIAYTDFGGGGRSETALYDLGARLVGEDFRLNDGAPLAKIAAAVAETPTLVIWDNLEAILRDGELALSPEALEELFQVAAQLEQAGDVRVCVITDTVSLPGQASSLAEIAMALPVGGLSTMDGVELIRARMAVRGTAVDDKGIEGLIESLGGHPLALCVLAACSGSTTLGDVVAGLEAMMPALRTGEARLGNQALELSMEYLLRSCGDDIRAHLAGLGLFAGGGMEPLVRRMLAVGAQEIDASDWTGTKEMLTAAQLMVTESLPSLNVPYVRFHPSLTRSAARRLSGEQLATLRARFAETYTGLLGWLAQTETRAPQAVGALAREELPNLRRGLEALLGAQKLKETMAYTRYLRHFLELLGFLGERDHVAGRVEEAIKAAIPPEGPLGRPAVRFLLSQSEQLMASGRIPEAGTTLQQLMQRMGQEDGLSYKGDEASLDQGVAYHRFGRFLRGTGRPDMIMSAFGQALQKLEGLGLAEARQELVTLYGDMSEVLAAGRQLDQAQEFGLKGLSVADEIEDVRAKGDLNLRLGGIAAARGDHVSALSSFSAALEHFHSLEDDLSTAKVWSQLGSLAEHLSDLTEAERCYREALPLTVKAGDEMAQAQTLMQLAQVCDSAGRPEEAADGITQAIGIYQKRQARAALMGAEMAMSELLLRRGDLDSARIHAEAARSAAENLPNFQPWGAYSLLQRVAQAQGDDERAAHWRTRTQQAFAASPESGAVLQQWSTLIEAVARSCRGEALDLGAVQLMEELETSEQWERLVLAIWRVLGGERGDELYAELDHVDALVVRSILEAIDRPEESEEQESQEG